jgi:WD40 repeat protein
LRDENKNPIAVWTNVHQRGVNHISIDRRNSYLFSVGEDRNMCVFDIRNKEKLPEKPFMHFKCIHSKAVLSSHIGKENKFLMTCSEGTNISVFDIDEMIESYSKKLDQDRLHHKCHHDPSHGDGHGGNSLIIGGDASRQTTEVQQNSGLGLMAHYSSAGR